MTPAGFGSAYAQRRDWIARYFDERADRWESLTGSEPVGRIRTTVRQGRRTVQDAVLSWLPDDLTGATVLDAGCGPGSFALRLAERGARVTAVDVSTELTRIARRRADDFAGPGSVDVLVGDMLDFGRLGSFDYVVALDSLINYPLAELRDAVAKIGDAAREGVAFTVAPRTPLLSVMHAVGKVFPRGQRAPSIEPVRLHGLRQWIDASPEMAGWRVSGSRSVHRGFYISSALRLSRRGTGDRMADGSDDEARHPPGPEPAKP